MLPALPAQSQHHTLQGAAPGGCTVPFFSPHPKGPAPPYPPQSQILIWEMTAKSCPGRSAAAMDEHRELSRTDLRLLRGTQGEESRKCVYPGLHFNLFSLPE